MTHEEFSYFRLIRLLKTIARNYGLYFLRIAMQFLIPFQQEWAEDLNSITRVFLPIFSEKLDKSHFVPQL